MRVLIWISESTWEGCVDGAGAVLREDAELTLLHVSASDVEELAAGGGARLLGRRRALAAGPSLRALADDEARALLEQARARLGRAASLQTRRGRVEREVVTACVDTDLLVLARDGRQRLGPPSLGPRARFVVDHAPCEVLLVWPFGAPSEGVPPPPPPVH